MDKWEYIVCISKASDKYGDKLEEMMERYNRINLQEITYIEAKEFWEELKDEMEGIKMAVNVKSSTRDVDELNPLVKIMLNSALSRIKNKDITPLVVETYRPKLRQYYLYGQGRTVSACVGAGVPRKYAQQYARSGAKVTWTLNSIHIKRCAVDLIPQRKGQPIWNRQDKDTKKIIEIMESVGFEAGANWSSSPDSPHFQVLGIGAKTKNFTKKNANKYVVKMIQKKLKKAGFYDNYTIDGNWGKATTNAIKKWKKSLGWRKTAKIGTTALKKLLSY